MHGGLKLDGDGDDDGDGDGDGDSLQKLHYSVIMYYVLKIIYVYIYSNYLL